MDSVMESRLTTTFFCTAGRGTEKFAADEIKEKIPNCNTDISDGKVFVLFDSISNEVNRVILHGLKSVERVFVCVTHIPSFRASHGWKGQKHVAEAITSISKEHWLNCLKLWQNLTGSTNLGGNQVMEQSEKRMKLNESYADITFRVSCKSSGHVRKFYDSQALARMFGISIKKYLHWTCDLRSALLEIFVQLNDQGLIIGFPVTKQPLSKREYFHDIGLRTPVAYIMAKLATIQPGDVVLDPMCGSGTILVEAVKSWPMAYYVGCDKDDRAVTKCKENIYAAQEVTKIQIFKADATALPLTAGLVNKVVCDMPFGQLHGTPEEMRNLYPKVLQSIHRIIRQPGKVILLTSQDLKDYLIKLVTNTETSSEGNAKHKTSTPGSVIASESGDASETSHAQSSPRSDKEDILHSDERITKVDSAISSRTSTEDSNISNSKVPAVNSKYENMDKYSDIESKNATPGVEGNSSCAVLSCANSQIADSVGCDIESMTGDLSETENTSGEKLSTCNWKLDNCHYIKLGETHSYICCFNVN